MMLCIGEVSTPERPRGLPHRLAMLVLCKLQGTFATVSTLKPQLEGTL